MTFLSEALLFGGLVLLFGALLARWIRNSDPMRCPDRKCRGKMVHFTVLDLIAMATERGVSRKDASVQCLPVAIKIGLVWYRCGKCHEFFSRRS